MELLVLTQSSCPQGMGSTAQVTLAVTFSSMALLVCWVSRQPPGSYSQLTVFQPQAGCHRSSQGPVTAESCSWSKWPHIHFSTA